MTGQMDRADERGQSIVIIALVFVVLLAFVALGTDAGFAFMRSSQFSAAVDSAALAGVTDLDPAAAGTASADDRAKQFLNANGWSTDTLTLFTSARSLTGQGVPQYTITVTWPVQFFFARLIGLDNFPITHSATAAFYASAEIDVTSSVDEGRIRTASQFLFGGDACTFPGDPVMPIHSTMGPPAPNLDYQQFDGVYRYRIRVPIAYTQTVRVEIFDPDARNGQFGNDFSVTHSNAYSMPNQTLSCASAGNGDRCVIDTGENREAVFHNPLWFARVDQNWDAGCSQLTADPNGAMDTTFELYYLDEDGERNVLSTYAVDSNDPTDLLWITPGIDGNTADNVLPGGSTFEVDMSATGVPTNTGIFRLLYLDVRSPTGTAKNVWDIKAGPPPGFYTAQGLPAPALNVNERNLQIANNPGAYALEGITVVALGRMPLENFAGNEEITLPLTPIDITLGNSAAYIRVFDFDGSNPATNIDFTVDTLLPTDFNIQATIIDGSPDPTTFQATCPINSPGTNCNNSWTYPQWQVGFPETYFAGGTLQAEYIPNGDAHTWSVYITAGRPFLTD